MAFSPNYNFVMVNYHYVEDPRPDFTGIHPCSVKEFERQIVFLSKHYNFVSVPELFSAARESANTKMCAITFDDGLKDQMEHAVPILKAHGATATFFVITGTLAGIVPLAHKIHLISSRSTMEELANAFNAFLSRSFPAHKDEYHIPSDRRITDRRLHEDALSANVKETLIMIPQDIRDAFLMEILEELNMNEADICKHLFMSEDEIRKLEHDGFMIGSHTHHHESLEHKNEQFLGEDVRTSRDVLSRFLSHAPTVISYPHGRINEAMRNVLTDAGFTHGVTIERREVRPDDDAFLLPRFDTMDIRTYLDTYEHRN